MQPTILFDLDDTLLNTNLQDFVPAYFQALAENLAPHVAADRMLRALVAGTRRMNESDDPGCSLEQVFSEEFYSAIGVPRGPLNDVIEHFYDHVFPSLGVLTSPVPQARAVVDWAVEAGCRVALATDPLFPRKATEHRLRWAGFEPHEFELVSSFEGFHFSKTHPAYFAEFLGRLGWPEGPVIMVGNDPERDIRPAHALGLATYLVLDRAQPLVRDESRARGPLGGLMTWLEKVDFGLLNPRFETPESFTAILRSTPAVVHGLTESLGPEAWLDQGSADEWSITELVCHLRDTEKEVHQMQLDLFDQATEPFIPRPDTSVWVHQRDYRREDGAEALANFSAARKETLSGLTRVPAEGWARKARHAIFGPTNFLEVVRFIADHDRLHIHQAWRILHPPSG